MKANWKELKTDEIVHYYGPGISKFHLKSKAVVLNMTINKNMIDISIDETPSGSQDGMLISHITAHRCQIRKIKPKEQKIRVTKKQLAEAYNKAVRTEANKFNYIQDSLVLRELLKELGFKD